MTTGDSTSRPALAPAGSASRTGLKKTWGHAAKLLNSLGPLMGLAVVCVYFTYASPYPFMTRENLQTILIQMAVVATAALGATVVIVSGGIDLTPGPSIALGIVVIAQMLRAGYPPSIAAIAGIFACVCTGLTVGLLVTVFDLAPFIVTLGMWDAVRGYAKQRAGDTNLNPPPAVQSTWLFHLLNGLKVDQKWMIFPIGVWIMFGLTVLVGLILRYTRFGRHVFAIGSNEQTARLCGVRVKPSKVMIYVFAGLFTGLAAMLEFSHLRVGDPTDADGLELNVIAAVVIGGTSLTGGEGGVAGTLVGAMLMAVIQNGCTKMGWSDSSQQIDTGCIIVLAAILDRFRHRRLT
jgi:ribose/xylose/arabinose/galactoside ABC-type transport system permease subunit